MTPGEVLDAQGDFIDRLGDPTFCEMLDGFGDLEFGRSGGYKKEHTTPLSVMLGRNMKVAHAFRVTHDMAMLVQHAADQLDGLDRFDHSLAPTGSGFVAFDRPLPIIDQRGRTMLMHYLTWGPASVRNGVSGSPETVTFFSMFNDQWRQADQVSTEMEDDYVKVAVEEEGLTEEEAREKSGRMVERYRRVMGRWAAIGTQVGYFEQRLGPQMSMPGEKEQAKLIAEGVTPHMGTNALRYIHALWLMMNQTVARKDPDSPDRKARRRAERRKLPPKVTVVRLRREAGVHREEGESDIEWAHRWVVRGHWRWAHVGPHHVLAQEIAPGDYRARIWIHPHVKGPVDAPFVQSEKVYSLER